MRYPYIDDTGKSREIVSVFSGYNHKLDCAENEFFEMQNMTSMYYPVTSNKNYGEYPVKRNGEVRGSLYGTWYNTESNLARFFGRSNDKADYVIDYVTVVNMDNIRRGKNLAPYAVGFALVTYVFDHDSTNH